MVKKYREFQTRWHKPLTKTWDVAITTGSQDGCSKIFEMFIEAGDAVMVQIPAYAGITGAVSDNCSHCLYLITNIFYNLIILFIWIIAL